MSIKNSTHDNLEENVTRDLDRCVRHLRDLRIYLRGLTHGGGKLDIPIESGDLQNDLALAEMAIIEYKKQRARKSVGGRVKSA